MKKHTHKPFGLLRFCIKNMFFFLFFFVSFLLFCLFLHFSSFSNVLSVYMQFLNAARLLNNIFMLNSNAFGRLRDMRAANAACR